MPIASGAGHWPKEHIVSPVAPATPKPSGPGYVQSYMPQWVPPNKVQPPKTSYVSSGGNPSNPKSPYPSPNYPGGQGNPGYDTPPPRYNSTTPNSPRGGNNEDYPPGGPRNGQQPPGNDNRPPYGNQGRNPSYNSRSYEQRPPPARMFRAGEKYGQAGHNRFGNDGLRPETDFGHNKYGVRYDSNRSVIVNSKGTRPVGPRGLESYEMYGPRMNMTTGLCGPQMRPLCALLGGLLALAALGGIIAGIALGVKSKMDASNKKVNYVSPFKNIRYYQQNGVYTPCVDRYATTTAVRTTTPVATTTPAATTTTTRTPATSCIPLTINTDTTQAATTVTTHAATTVTTAKGATTGKPPTTTPLRTTTVCIYTTRGTTTPAATTTTTVRPTTTVITTTPPPTTTTTLPFCDTLTTTYTLVTLYPLVLPPSTAATAGQTLGVTVVMMVVVTLSAKRFVG